MTQNKIENSPNWWAVKHGRYKTPEYRAWQKLIDRCENPKSQTYHNYGGRGIAVCDRWHSFTEFYADMGDRPSPQHSIDRINNDGNYEPSNCRWATIQEQNSNRRDNRIVEVNGLALTTAEWARRLGINGRTFACRIEAGWSPEEAVSRGVARRIWNGKPNNPGCGTLGWKSRRVAPMGKNAFPMLEVLSLKEWVTSAETGIPNACHILTCLVRRNYVDKRSIADTWGRNKCYLSYRINDVGRSALARHKGNDNA